MTNPDLINDMPEMLSENRKRLVLIVEDEEINREILKINLDRDYEILTAETGAEALETIRVRADTLSLVLLDLILPDTHGLDILRRLKEEDRLSRIPIIVLTSDTAAEVESLNSGASDFIPKPYPRQEIIMARARRSEEETFA